MLRSWRGLMLASALGAGLVVAEVASGGLTPISAPAASLLNPFSPTLHPAPVLATTSLITTSPTPQPISGPVLPATTLEPTVAPPSETVIVTPITGDPISVGPIRRPPVRDPVRPPTRSPFRP